MNTKLSYSQQQNGHTFDWYEALQKDCQNMTSEDTDILYHSAASWDICACGQQCATIPRTFEGEPKDTELRNLGRKFYEQIDRMCTARKNKDYESADSWRRKAIHTHSMIEQRAQELLDGMAK